MDRPPTPRPIVAGLPTGIAPTIPSRTMAPIAPSVALPVATGHLTTAAAASVAALGAGAADAPGTGSHPVESKAPLLGELPHGLLQRRSSAHVGIASALSEARAASMRTGGVSQARSSPESDDSTGITPVQQMISSCSGALLTSLLMTPFDVVKAGNANCVRVLFCNGLMDFEYVCECERSAPRYKGTWDAFVKIPQRDGVSALWRGLTPTLVMSVPATMLYFAAYDQLRTRFDPLMSPAVSPFFAGLTARVLSTSIISPLELIRTKAQSLHAAAGGYNEIFAGIREMVRVGGVWSLWRGLVPTLWRDVPFSGLYWTVYEHLKRKQLSLGYNQHVAAFSSGAVAGTIAAFVTTPFDVVKTYRQIDLTAEVAQRLTMRQTLEVILREKGWRGLFAGTVPRIAKVTPACAIMVGSYEAGKNYFGEKNRLDRLARRNTGHFDDSTSHDLVVAQ